MTLSLWLLTLKLVSYLTIVDRDPQLVAVDLEVALAEALTLRTAREQCHQLVSIDPKVAKLPDNR